uniref:hypothetical protein n=1 Tax=Streptomyces scabiei TaxID=1930 RepID=UPI0013C4CE26|nr:hypothetical protein [Streptomyces scabiei]
MATALDGKMLAGKIAEEDTPIESLREISGDATFAELGGRSLLRYLRNDQKGSLTGGSHRLQYVTPTPYTPEEASLWLALMWPWVLRRYVLVLDPRKIDRPIRGPRVISGGFGIEYILPDGFPASAIANPGYDLEVT